MGLKEVRKRKKWQEKRGEGEWKKHQESRLFTQRALRQSIFYFSDWVDLQWLFSSACLRLVSSVRGRWAARRSWDDGSLFNLTAWVVLVCSASGRTCEVSCPVKPVWAPDPDDESDICGHFQCVHLCVFCPLECWYCLSAIVHSAEMMMFWLRRLSTQPGCNVWFYQQSRLMWSGMNGGQQSWRVGLWGNMAWDLMAAKLPADGLKGAEVCWWGARWLRAQLVPEIKRLSTLCLLKQSSLLGVLCSF